jgi:hypothetical protein
MAARKGLRVVRRGTAKDENLRTYIVAKNGKDLMGSTQGYNATRDRLIQEELALEALFKDPVMRAKATVLALELVDSILARQHLSLSQDVRTLILDDAIYEKK